MIGFIVFAFVISSETFNVLPHTPVGHGAPWSFYDAQAQSLLHGHLDVPAKASAGESIVIGGKYFTVYGPTPALLRMPVLALFPQTEGHLNALSMCTALVFILYFTSRLSWQLRKSVRGDAQVTRGEQWAVGGLLVLVASGSVILFLASFSFVYHEAIIWGIAFSLGTVWFAIRFLTHPTCRRLAGLTLCASLTLLSRQSLGVGAVAIVGLIGLVTVLRALTQAEFVRHRVSAATADRLERRLVRATGSRMSASDTRRWAIATLVALVAPIVLYAAVNEAKFGSPFSIPWEKYVWIAHNPTALKHYHENGFLGPQYLLSDLVQYTRPDTLSASSLFPWVVFRFPHPRSSDIFNPFHASYYAIAPHSSITATMPTLTALALVGVFTALRPRRRNARSGEADPALLRLPLIGLTIGALAMLTLATIVDRYLGDLVPLLVVAGVLGLFTVMAWKPGHLRWKKVATVALILGGIWSVAANAGLAINAQHTDQEATPESTRNYRNFQQAVARIFDGAPTETVDRTPANRPPAHARRGDLWRPTDCSTLYWFDGGEWLSLGTDAARGELHLRVKFPTGATGRREPIVSRMGTDGLEYSIAVGYDSSRRLTMSYDVSYRRHIDAAPVGYNPKILHEVDATLRADRVVVVFDGLTVLEQPLAATPSLGPPILGRHKLPTWVAPRFSGTIRPEATDNLPCNHKVSAILPVASG